MSKETKTMQSALQPIKDISTSVPTKGLKYNIIDDYVYSSLTHKQIAEKYKTTEKNIDHITSRFFKAIMNARESRILCSAVKAKGDYFLKFKELHLNPVKVNEAFLELISSEDDTYLTKSELLFCELLTEDGDLNGAIENSGLAVGLLKDADNGADRTAYNNSLKMRGFFLTRKPNVRLYLEELQKLKIQAVTDGKMFVQNELLSVIKKLKNQEGTNAASLYLKAVDSLSRTYGAFNDKLEIEGIDGSSAIDKIIAKAKAATANVVIEVEPDGI